MIFTAHTQEEMLRQLLTPKREGELVNPHISTQKASTSIDFAEVSRRLSLTSQPAQVPAAKTAK